MSDFKKKVLKVVSKIPKGGVMTYKEVAEKAGKPKAYRAVGNILKKNYNSLIPCHRVIRSDGKLGGYNRGIENKIYLLKIEGAFEKINKKCWLKSLVFLDKTFKQKAEE